MNSVSYVRSLLTFYLKGKISWDETLVKLSTPNTILGLIPLGSKNENIPVNQISSTESNFKLKIGKLLLGIVVFIFALSSFGTATSNEAAASIILGVILLIVAANLVLDAFEIDLTLKMTSGEIRNIDFFIFDKEKANIASHNINKIIVNRLNDTNSRVQTDRIVDAINNK